MLVVMLHAACSVVRARACCEEAKVPHDTQLHELQ
jgi:hypothetical protein